VPAAPPASPFENFRRDQGHGFRVVELETAVTAPARHIGGDKDHQLIDFSRRQMHSRYSSRC
jgi:hypothetical protein